MDGPELLTRLNVIHGGVYQYVNVGDKVRACDSIDIVCKQHGVFTQRVHDHLYHKAGCPRCADDQKRTGFVDLAVQKYGDVYDYSKVVYKNNFTPVTISCMKHGDFDQVPSVHLSSVVGCPKCKVDARTSTADGFASRASQIHNNKYTYGDVRYKSCKQKVTICCPRHGDFNQTPDNHLRGAGCPRCAGDTLRGKYVAGRLYDEDKMGTLYVARFRDTIEDFIKVGITSRQKTSHRYGVTHNGYQVDVLYEFKMPIRRANEVEREVLERLNSDKYSPNRKFGGYTECVSTSAIRVTECILTLIGDEKDIGGTK